MKTSILLLLIISYANTFSQLPYQSHSEVDKSIFIEIANDLEKNKIEAIPLQIDKQIGNISSKRTAIVEASPIIINSNATSTSFKESSLKSKVIVYPNPTSRFVNVDLSGLKKKNTNIKIQNYNSNGKLVRASQRTFNSKTKQIDLSKKAYGNYYIRILDGDKLLTIEKVILYK